MKPCFIAVAFGALLAACDARPPVSPVPAPAESFALGGRIQDTDGAPISGALIQLVTDATPTRTTESDTLGRYRFDKVGGLVRLRVTKENHYVVASSAVWVDRDTTVDVSLIRDVSTGSGPLTTVATFRGRVTNPPCDPQRWDVRALCERITFIPPATGDYELVLRWDGTSSTFLSTTGSLL